MTGDPERRVAIACQGGGSHTAFTAGVLGRLLTADELDRHQVVGFSGTSGGAVCAVLAWSALLDGDPRGSRARLEGFWADNSAAGPVERSINAWMLWATTLQSIGVLPAVSPYDIPVTGLEHFRALLRRWVDFDRIQVDRLARHPLLLIGAVDVLSGRFRAFHSRRDRITADMVLASAAIPTAFPTVHTDGGSYWDGLFSQNPPVRELLETQPDELWVIQINPTSRDTVPRSVLAIADRRNELAGNLSLYQELHVIEKIDQWLADGVLVSGDYKQVTVRVIEFARPRSSRWLGPASKVNRDARFLRGLMTEGARQADSFPHRPGLRTGVAPGRHRRVGALPRRRRRADLHRTVSRTRSGARTAAPRGRAEPLLGRPHRRHAQAGDPGSDRVGGTSGCRGDDAPRSRRGRVPARPAHPPPARPGARMTVSRGPHGAAGGRRRKPGAGEGAPAGLPHRTPPRRGTVHRAAEPVRS